MKYSPYSSQRTPSSTSAGPRLPATGNHSPCSAAQAAHSQRSARIAVVAAADADPRGISFLSHRSQNTSGIEDTVAPALQCAGAGLPVVPSLQCSLLAVDPDDVPIVCHGLPLADPGEAAVEPPEWVHVMPAEPFWHPRSKAPDQIVRPTWEFRQAIVDNFERYSLELLFDWEHASAPGSSKEAPAAAWADRLENREDGIWARVRIWTPRADRQVRDREYRYVSPLFVENARDRRTGEPIGPFLVSVGLVGTPHLDTLTPLSNVLEIDARGTVETEESPMDETILDLLGLGKDAGSQEVANAIRALRDRPALPATVAAALALAEDADEAMACSAIAALTDDNQGAHVALADHLVVKSEVITLQAKLQVIEDGVAPAVRDLACRLFVADKATYNEWVKTAPKVPVGAIKAPADKATPAANEPTAEQVLVCKQLGINIDDLKEAR
jgi:phage I-like protein